MIYYDRIDVSEGIDVNQLNQVNQMSAIFDNIRFLNKGFKFEPNVRNRYHD